MKSWEDPEYTLVLDLDETLVHFAEEHEKQILLENRSMLMHKIAHNQIYELVEDDRTEYFYVRPFATKLLTELSRYYEIAIFTAGTQGYADAILDELHCSKYISHRLYRHHTINEEDVYIKDLGLIGRPLEKTLIVDNTRENFMYHKENGIPIHSWYEDDKDEVLYDLTRILKRIAECNPTDIRDELKRWRPVIERYIQFGKKVPMTFYEIV